MSRWIRYGWCAFGVLLVLTIANMATRSADAQISSENKPPRTRCVGLSTCVAKDGDVLVFRAFEDGTIEERRVKRLNNGKIEYEWKPSLNPAG
jgi:hypothetical protein